MKIVTVQIQLEYGFDVETDKKATEEVENVELPSGYVEDSFEIIKVEDSNY